MSTQRVGTHLSLSPMSALHQPSKKGRDRNGHAPLNINYVSAGTYANFAPTIFAAAGLSKLPPVALPRAPMTWPICFLDVAPSSAIT